MSTHPPNSHSFLDWVSAIFRLRAVIDLLGVTRKCQDSNFGWLERRQIRHRFEVTRKIVYIERSEIPGEAVEAKNEALRSFGNDRLVIGVCHRRLMSVSVYCKKGECMTLGAVRRIPTHSPRKFSWMIIDHSPSSMTRTRV